MKNDKLVDAIGMISDDKIQNAKKTTAKVYKFSYRKAIALIAAIILCLTASIPVLAAATEIEPIYNAIYSISPSLAQKLKPVRLSCEDQGIRMEVESAYIYENEANIVVSMQDTEGDRVDKTTDLYDSYRINRPFSSTGTCSSLDYDEETGKATFLIKISQWGDKKIGGDKITFSVREFLSNKKEFNDQIPINLQDLDVITKTQNRTCYYHPPYENAQTQEWQEPCLIPNHEYEDFTDGIDMTGYGYINGKFHIQIAIKNRLENDNHGRFYLVDKEGNERYCDYSVDWRNTTKVSENKNRVDYYEYVFDIPQDDISNYELYGYFVTSEGITKGNWQVTFPLENMD